MNKNEIIVSKLESGTVIAIETLYSTYEITKIDDSKVWIQGGKFFPEKQEAVFVGSIGKREKRLYQIK